MGYNYYGEFVWFNDIFYMFFICIFGVLGLIVGLVIFDFVMIGELVDFFVIFLEILFEWYLYFIF